MNQPSQAPTSEVLAYSTKVAPSSHVTCTDCGAIIARHDAHAFVSQQQVGEVVELLRRFTCQDRENCQARGPITQRLAQLQAAVDGLQKDLAVLHAYMEESEENRRLNELEVRIEDLEQERDELKAALRGKEIVLNRALENLVEANDGRDGFKAQLALANSELGDLRGSIFCVKQALKAKALTPEERLRDIEQTILS